MALLSLSPTLARRLALTRQRLAGRRPPADARGLLDVVRDLGCLQLDPISVVDRSRRLVLWSRLGRYDLALLDTLLWQERRLFEYWAHCASIVLTEDYPLHSPLMRAYPWSDRTQAWVTQNQKLKRYLLSEIRRRGPLPSRALEADGLDPKAWASTGWTSGRNISRMLDFLWIGGKIMVAGRSGLQKLWDLAERCLPILHGDRLIGRIDPEMDRERGALRVNAIYAEPGAPATAGRALAGALEDLAAFLGAKDILYKSQRMPTAWKRALLA